MVASLKNAERNFLSVVNLFPGFQTNPTSEQNNYTLLSGSSVSFNGTGTRRHNVSDRWRVQRRQLRESKPTACQHHHD